MLCVRPAFLGIAGGIVRRKLFKQLQKLFLLGFVKVAHQFMAHLVPLGIGFLRGDAAFFRKRYVYGAAVLIVGGALYKPRRFKLCKHLACGAGLNVQPLGKGGLGYYIAAFQQHREHAPLAIKAAGISVVIAKSFARIFYRNAINIGLPILECPAASEAINEGDVVAINFDTGVITDETTGQTFQAAPFPPFIQKIIKAGGLMKSIQEGK